MSKYAIFFVCILSTVATLSVSVGAHAQVRGRCVPSPPCYCSDECLRCGPGGCRSSGGTSGGGQTTPTHDFEAERRAQEEAQRKREEDERIEAQRQQAERDRKFKEARDAAAKGLKSATPGGNSNTFGLKEATPSASELRTADPRVDRDLTGQRAAWKQIHCAASILSPALAALKPPDGRPIDFNEYRYLANEALNALNGQRLGVQCAPAPEMPQASNRAPDMDRAIASQRRLIERANTAVTQLEDAVRARQTRSADDERIAQVYAQQQANAAAIDKNIAPIREQQRQINQKRERKPGEASDPAAQQEARARRKLDEVVQDVKKFSQDYSVKF
ncbi:MAG: hypothetical protein K2Y31_00900 [Burkholderiales bacterium]|nr:hypothetical protein [Burkholderiales bacterium]